MATIIPESNNNNSSFDVVCRTAPQKKNYDNLQFKISNTIRYIDEGLWENRIQKIADTSLSTSANSERSSSSDSHESLDHICTHEIKRRNPSGFKIGGVKGFIESLIQGLFDKMKLNQTFSYFTDSAIKKYKQQIAHSITNRHDLKSVIKIQHPELREQLGIVDDNQLATTHVLQKNSPVNGQSYLDESGNRIDVTQGISSSSDRKVENTGNLRRIAAAATDSSICYTGRVETKNKALEQASFIFLSELKASRSGITPPTDENEIYSLDYVVSSVMTANLVMAAKIPKICPVAEREMIYDEKQVLEELSTMEFVEITDPETGTVYKVKLNPIMFSDPFNAFHKFEYTLSEDISGVDITEEMSTAGMRKIQALVDHKISQLKALMESASAEEQEKIQTKIAEIAKAQDQYVGCDYKNFPEHRIFIRDYLYKLLDIPVVYHCKSSTDRTGVLVALSSALKQWMDLGKEIPEDITSLLSCKYFKELFAANLMTGHQITRYARSFEGSIDGKKGCEHKLGYSLGRGIFQNPVIQRLMPERYLRKTTTKEMVLAYLQVGMIQVGSIFLVVFKMLYNIGMAFKRLIMDRQLTNIQEIFKPVIHFNPFNMSKFIPNKVLNETSPQVGARNFLSSTKAKCPEVISSCMQKTSECQSCDNQIKTRLRNAAEPKEIKKQLLQYKKHNLQGLHEKANIRSQTLIKDFAKIESELQKDPDYDYHTPLAELKESGLNTLHRDLTRTEAGISPRRLVINGKNYGAAIEGSSCEDTEKLGHAQSNEIYEIIKDFYVKAKPEYSQRENEIALEKAILLTIDELHQGAMAPLMSALYKEFNGKGAMIGGCNDFYEIDLRIDPYDVHDDGRVGTMHMKRMLIMEIVDEGILYERQSRSIPLKKQPRLSFLENIDLTRDDSNEYTVNDLGLKKFMDPKLQGYAKVVAFTENDASIDGPLYVRTSVEQVY